MPASTTKQCTGCRRRKLLDEFYIDSRGGRRPRCKVCYADDTRSYNAKPEAIARRRRRQSHPEYKAAKRRAFLLRKYGLTEERYEELLASQGGCCAICETREPGGRHNTHFYVDHDHACCGDTDRTCGKCVRGLLCHNCNVRLAVLEDDLWRAGASRYLDMAL